MTASGCGCYFPLPLYRCRRQRSVVGSLPDAPQLVHDRSRIWAQVCVIPKSGWFSLHCKSKKYTLCPSYRFQFFTTTGYSTWIQKWIPTFICECFVSSLNFTNSPAFCFLHSLIQAVFSREPGHRKLQESTCVSIPKDTDYTFNFFFGCLQTLEIYWRQYSFSSTSFNTASP